MATIRRIIFKPSLLKTQKLAACQMNSSRMIDTWQGDRKQGFQHKVEQISNKHKILSNIKQLPAEFVKFRQEAKEHFIPNYWELEHRDYIYQWRLNTQEAIDEWTVSTDEDMDVGFSKGQIQLSRQKCMQFSGYLDTRVPDDGKTEYSGYVNVGSPLKMLSFGRIIPYDWSYFTHLVIRCKGDGRPYALNIHMDNYFDMQWLDIYSFVLYTRGGPYWQVAKIPFSKFLLSYKGRVQDKQEMVHLQRVRNFSLTTSDTAKGPFNLELDYIGLVYDAYHDDKFFYEMYDHDPLMS